MTVTVFALVTVNDNAPEDLATYMRVTEPLLQKAGAQIVKRFFINEVVVGKMPAKSAVIVTYPNRQAVSQMFDSPEYKSIKEVRDRAFLTYQVSVVEGHTSHGTNENGNSKAKADG